MNTLLNYTVSLSSVSKAAALDMGEDFTKVEATYNHYAVRGLKDMSNKILRIGGYRGIFPIHKNFKTVQVPLGCKRITMCAIIDECGEKIPLIQKHNLVGNPEEIDCVDKCKECGQGKDVCEKLNIEETKENVTIVGSSGTPTVLQNVTTKYFDNGSYYLVKKFWVFDVPSNAAKQVTESEFITEFDMLDCGCLAQTEENIEKVKTHCYDCYCSCFTSCRKSDSDIGGYKVIDDKIFFDKFFPEEKIYLEWEGILQKKDGVFAIPEIASETIIAYIKHRATWNRKSIGLTEKQMYRQDYIFKMNDCEKILSRIGLAEIKDSVRKIGMISHSTPNGDINCNNGYGNSSRQHNKEYINYKSYLNTTAQAPPPNVIISTVRRFEYTAIGGEKIIGSVFDTFSGLMVNLTGKMLLGFEKDGVGFSKIITSGTPIDKQVKFTQSTGAMEIAIEMYAGEEVFGYYI